MNYFIIILIIVLLFFIYNNLTLTENFQSDNQKNIIINIFLSKSCPHCVSYKMEHENIKQKILSLYPKASFNLLYADEHRELFNENEIEYVPACMMNINNKGFVKMNNRINAENLIEFIKNN
jgi:thiol-disulfide isomerase/thioredoxin